MDKSFQKNVGSCIIRTNVPVGIDSIRVRNKMKL